MTKKTNKLRDIKQKFYKTLKNNRGITSFEAVVGLMIIIVVLAGIVDFSNTSVQLSNISNVTNYISRIVSEQGGISNTRPSNYYDDVYTTSSDAFNYIDNHMRNNGITDWELIIDVKNTSHTFSANTSIGPLAYDTPVTITLNFKYPLKLLSGFLDIGEISQSSHRSVKTTLHPRNSDLEIEF